MRLDDAGAYLREQPLLCAYCGMAFRVAAAVAAARGKLLDQAAVFLAGAEAMAMMWRGGPWPAALDEARAEIAYAAGDLSGARERLRAAADGFAHDGRRLDADRVVARLSNLE